MRYYSICNTLCIFAENISIGVFALFDCGIMSVVYGKWVFVVLWVVLFVGVLCGGVLWFL